MMEKEIAVEKKLALSGVGGKRYDAYKDSGVEWLGEIPEHWEVLPLFALTKLKSVINQVNLELLSVYLDLGVIRFSDVVAKRTNVTSLDLSKYQLVEPGDFVLNNQQAWRGSVGISKHKGIVSPAYIVLSLSEKFNPDFANYLFRDGTMVSQYLINSKGVGTIQRNLYWPSLRRSNITLPPLQEQTKIAQFLDDKTTKIDDAIAIKQQQIQLLKERKQILIHKAVTQGLNPNVTLKDSGVEWIGEIPEHWEIKNLRYAFKFLNSKRVPLSAVEREKMQGAFPYYGASGIIDYVDDYIFDEKLILIGEDGANLLSKSTPLAFVAEGKYWVNNHAHILKPIFEGFPYWAEQLSLIDYTIFISGAAQPKLSRGNLGSVKVIVPTLTDLKEISAYIETASQKIEISISLKQQEIAKLKEYKSSLINGVVTGKVRVC